MLDPLLDFLDLLLKTPDTPLGWLLYIVGLVFGAACASGFLSLRNKR